MNNQSVRMNLSMDGRENIKVEVNGILREQGLRTHMGKKIWHCKRDLMQLDRDMGHKSKNNIEVRGLVGWSVEHMVRRTLGEIVCNIRMVGLRYIVNMRHKLFGMLVIVFHVSMKKGKTGK